MRRRTNRPASSPRRPRRPRRPSNAETDAAHLTRGARSAYEAWLAEVGAERESLVEELAAEYGVDLTDLEGAEWFESLLDAMEAEVWAAAGRRRVTN